MYKEKTNRRLIGLGVVLFAAGMAAAYLWDLPIDTALHSPQNFAAIFMETMGFYPLYLPVVLWLALIGNDEKRPVALRALCMLGAVAGCGGAFVSLFLEALADGAVTCGLPRDKARRYAAQMVLGTAQLALQSGQHTAAMKDAVCSPGGTTIAGVRALERGGFRSAAMEAVIAAYEKTLALKS